MWTPDYQVTLFCYRNSTGLGILSSSLLDICVYMNCSPEMSGYISGLFHVLGHMQHKHALTMKFDFFHNRLHAEVWTSMSFVGDSS